MGALCQTLGKKCGKSPSNVARKCNVGGWPCNQSETTCPHQGGRRGRPSLNTIISRVILLGKFDGPDAISCIRAHDRLPRVWFAERSWNLVDLKARSPVHRDRIWDAAALALLALEGTHVTLKLGQAGLHELQKSNSPGQPGSVVGQTKDTSGDKLTLWEQAWSSLSAAQGRHIRH